MAKGYTLGGRSIARISEAVKRTERQPGFVIQPNRRQRPPPASSVRMLKASEAMTADNTLYNAVWLNVDGTKGNTVQVYRPNGIGVAANDIGILTQDASGRYVFFLSVNPVFYKFTNARLVLEVGSTGSIGFAQQYDGVAWNTTIDRFMVWKFDDALQVPTGEQATIWVDSYLTTCTIGYSGHSGTAITQLASRFVFSALLENFTLATLTRAQLEALSASSVTYAQSFTVSVTSGNPSSNHGSTTNGIKYAHAVTGNVSIYGASLYVDDGWISTVGTSVNTDTRTHTEAYGAGNCFCTMPVSGSETSR